MSELPDALSRALTDSLGSPNTLCAETISEHLISSAEAECSILARELCIDGCRMCAASRGGAPDISGGLRYAARRIGRS